MSGIPCRDCGYMLEANARGCPRCALNLEAENMIDRLFWRRIVPAVIVVVLLVVGVMFYVLR